MQNIKKFAKQLSGVLVIVLLNACGGGGGGGTGTGSGGGTGTGSNTSVPANETINGISVPPAPTNPTATIAGTDANANGVRDDVERALATRLGKNQATYEKSIIIAAQMQVVATGSSSTAAQAIAAVATQPSCGDAQLKAAQEAALDEVFNNKERYAKAMEAYATLIEAKIAADDVASLFTTACR